MNIVFTGEEEKWLICSAEQNEEIRKGWMKIDQILEILNKMQENGQKELEESESKIKALRGRLETTHTDFDQTVEILGSTNAQLSQKEKELTNTTTKLQETEEELSKTTTILQEINTKLEVKEEELSKTTTELQETNEKLEMKEEELSKTTTKLQETNTKLEVKEEELRKTTIELQEINEKLKVKEEELVTIMEELNKTKTEFQETIEKLIFTERKLQITNNELNNTKNKLTDTENLLKQVNIIIDNLNSRFKGFDPTVEPYVEIMRKTLACDSTKIVLTSIEDPTNTEEILRFLRLFGTDFSYAVKIYNSMRDYKKVNRINVNDKEMDLINALNQFYRKNVGIDFDVLELIDLSQPNVRFDRLSMQDFDKPASTEFKYVESVYVPALRKDESTIQFRALIKGRS